MFAPKHFSRRKLRDRRRGAAVVEFAVISPLFVAILLGTIEACSMIFLRQTVELAAFEAARVAIVRDTTAAQVQQAAKNVLDTRKVKGYDIKVTPTDFQAAAYGTFIQVEVSAPCSTNGTVPIMFYSGKNIVGQVEMMKEY
ncbi:MAG: TadE/TadG family type IV pilus assembly protein [Planctomycetota bacterium]|jgi:Flp pilus assembly protein TadG